ncbi:MAG: hypothetical protein GPJ50_15570 [Candidatus Heimdallarchaeota archaeon]|nr:hypothetical protein [Candidatus Heimdallarchaeota archaeon]
MTKTKGVYEWAKNNFNISIGCFNDCKYCYSSSIAHRHGRVQRDCWKNMYTKSYAKIDEQLKRLPKTKNTDPDLYDIMFPSSHDLFEENLEEACYALSKILELGKTILIVTKPRIAVISELIYRFQDYKKQILFRFTMGTADDDVRQYWETNASTVRERMICLYLAYKAGFNTSVSIEPFLEDYTLIKHIKRIHSYVTHDIWVGPMNFTHVPKKYIEELNQDLYYTPKNLLRIKKEIDSLGFDNIRYKDHFLNKIKLEVST